MNERLWPQGKRLDLTDSRTVKALLFEMVPVAGRYDDNVSGSVR